MQRSSPDPRALLIDAMGTLLRLRAPVPALVSELRSRCGVAVSQDEAGAALRAEIAYYRAHMDEGRDAAAVEDLRRRCAGVLAAALPSELMPELVGAGDDAVLEALLGALRFDAYPDAPPALMRARASGRRVVVVSNWDASLHEALERTGLAPLLDGVAVSAAVGARKPAAEIFEHGLALAGVPARRALHVGDSPAEDVDGARAAGIEAVLIDRAGAASGEGVINSLDELLT